MGQNFADLVMGADTRGLDKGVKSLDDVVTAGGKAETSVDRVGDEFEQTGKQAATAGTKIKMAATATDKAHAAAVRASAQRQPPGV